MRERLGVEPEREGDQRTIVPVAPPRRSFPSPAARGGRCTPSSPCSSTGTIRQCSRASCAWTPRTAHCASAAWPPRAASSTRTIPPPPRSRTGIGDKGRRNRTPDPNAWLAARLLGLSVFERHVAPSSMCRLLTASTFLVNRSTRCEYSRLDSSRARPRRRTRRRLTCPLCCREHVYPLIVERAIIVAFLSPAPIWGHVGARSFGCSCARTNSRPPSRSVTQSSIVSRTSSCRRRNYDDRTHQGRGRCTPEST